MQDILNPVAVSLSPSSFEDAIFNKNPDDVWVVEFFAPWCEPCHQVSIQLKKMAKVSIFKVLIITRCITNHVVYV